MACLLYATTSVATTAQVWPATIAGTADVTTATVHPAPVPPALYEIAIVSHPESPDPDEPEPLPPPPEPRARPQPEAWPVCPPSPSPRAAWPVGRLARPPPAIICL